MSCDLTEGWVCSEGSRQEGGCSKAHREGGRELVDAGAEGAWDRGEVARSLSAPGHGAGRTPAQEEVT